MVKKIMNKINNLLMFIGLAGIAALAQAQSAYPTRAVRLIVPSAPGGGTTFRRASLRRN